MAQKFKTRDNGEATVFGTNQNAARPYVGAYWTGDEWIPTTWKADGTWHPDAGHPRGLDLMLNQQDPAKINENV